VRALFGLKHFVRGYVTIFTGVKNMPKDTKADRLPDMGGDLLPLLALGYAPDPVADIGGKALGS
jgi:hypothetical protein